MAAHTPPEHPSTVLHHYQPKHLTTAAMAAVRSPPQGQANGGSDPSKAMATGRRRGMMIEDNEERGDSVRNVMDVKNPFLNFITIGFFIDGHSAVDFIKAMGLELAGRRRASLASSGLHAGIAGVGGMAAAAPGRSMAVSGGSWAERERLGRLAEAFGQRWARADGRGRAGQQRLDGRGLAGSETGGRRGLQETLVANTDGPDGPAASQPAIDRPLTPSPSASMGNIKLVPVAGLAITVRLSSHMMHATSSPTEITLHSALHGQAASSHIYKRADAMGEKDTEQKRNHTQEREKNQERVSGQAGQLQLQRARWA
ncbi:hypothetical protein ACLOJK_000075 [Asimina triloba]